MINFKLEKFEGPLGLLLQLIEKEEMDITQVSLSRVADQYIEYIKSADDIGPGEMADFLVIAAKLLLIKSRALLPYLYPEEEEGEVDDLEAQLRMYKEFLEATKKIESMLGKKKFMFAREFNRQAALAGASTFSPPKNLKLDDLKMTFSDILSRIKPMEDMEERVLEAKVNIDDKILEIKRNLAARARMSFNQVLLSAKSKTEVIVSFLAMLELVKQRDIFLTQENLFDEIFINKI